MDNVHTDEAPATVSNGAQGTAVVPVVRTRDLVDRLNRRMKVLAQLPHQPLRPLMTPWPRWG